MPAQSPPPSPTSAPPPPTGAFATTVALASTAGPSAAGTQVQASASCPAGSALVAGGFNLRTTDGTVPNNSLRALAAVPSTAA
ncbi:MAG TPA: hypothetical protein VHA57_06385, partial [Actinomycetota bacterium]|nr:hypothetical protein [Actinomycetota bacterium]